MGRDNDSPDKIVARKENLHETDKDFDHELSPDDGGETINAAGIKSIPRDALKVLLRYIVHATSLSQQKR